MSDNVSTLEVVIARESGRSSNHRRLGQIANAAAYWTPRFRGA
jgi:hypothetical protein